MTKGTACEARMLAHAERQLPRFKPSDWRQDDPRAGTVAGNNSLDMQITTARAQMGPDRWNALQKEWRND